jgi:hypothetical protein
VKWRVAAVDPEPRGTAEAHEKLAAVSAEVTAAHPPATRNRSIRFSVGDFCGQAEEMAEQSVADERARAGYPKRRRRGNGRSPRAPTKGNQCKNEHDEADEAHDGSGSQP